MPKNKIVIKGAREHNLKDIDVEIPRNKLVVITGLSGSGKSSLAFDTIYAEGQRRYAESFSAYTRQFLGTVDKPDVDQIEGLSPTISIDQRTLANNPRSTVGTMTEIYDYLRLLFARIGKATCQKCGGKIIKKKILIRSQEKSRQSKNKYLEFYLCRKCGERFPKLEPRLFSFNSPQGACSACKGLGTRMNVDLELLVPNKKLSLSEGAIQPWTKFFSNQILYWKKLEGLAKKYRIPWDKPADKITPKQWEVILYGEGDRKEDDFAGVANILLRKYEQTDSEFLRKEIGKYLKESICSVCQGDRLSKEALAVKVGGLSISEIAKMDLEKSAYWFSKLKLQKEEKKIGEPILKEIKKRIQALLDIGLGYLTLDRSAVTLSGGETQRIKIASQLNSLLTNVIYVLDEPSVGLHPQDIGKLVRALQKIRDAENTVIVVEHDENIIRSADWIIDMGPGAGVKGGEVVAEGTLAKILKSPSLTARYLRGKRFFKKNLSSSRQFLEIKGAKEHNLKNIDVKIPLGELVCITGVSGSGKSTLVIDILGKALLKKFYRAKESPGEHERILGVENINKVVPIDQSPIGKTPRSNPATYTGIFTYIRNLFASLPQSQERGFDAGFFSFNVDGGRCPLCSGEGYVKVEMQFLPDVYVECEACGGRRYSEEALNVFYKGKNIADILDMDIESAFHFFEDVSIISDKLDLLRKVGLGYLPLGQSATTLSGGEAQRIKLATELSRKDTGRTLYILDEPTTGLHFDDIKKLLNVLELLVKRGNTVVVIEHNLDIIRSADWIIDMGPEGGDKGGEIIAEGPPEVVAKNKKSLTGKHLAKIIK